MYSILLVIMCPPELRVLTPTSEKRLQLKSFTLATMFYAYVDNTELKYPREQEMSSRLSEGDDIVVANSGGQPGARRIMGMRRGQTQGYGYLRVEGRHPFYIVDNVVAHSYNSLPIRALFWHISAQSGQRLSSAAKHAASWTKPLRNMGAMKKRSRAKLECRAH